MRILILFLTFAITIINNGIIYGQTTTSNNTATTTTVSTSSISTTTTTTTVSTSFSINTASTTTSVNQQYSSTVLSAPPSFTTTTIGSSSSRSSSSSVAATTSSPSTNGTISSNSKPASVNELFSIYGYIPLAIGGFIFVVMLYSFFFGALARRRYKASRRDVLIKTAVMKGSTKSKSRLSRLGYGIPGLMKPSNSALVSPMSMQRGRRRAPREKANNQINSKMLDALASVEQGLSIPGFLQFEKDKDFRSEKYLTSGGSGQIFIGTALNPEIAKFGKQVIVKEFNNMKGQSDKDSFFQEVSIMYLLRDHKNIAKMAGFSSDPTFALVLKYYPLGAMQTWISKGPKQATKHKGILLALIQDICDGIMFMHMHGLAHADLKPSNVLLDVDSRKNLFGVLSDFGITRIVNENILKVKHFHTVEINGASRPYAAPETLTQLRKKGPSNVDYLKADIYSTATVIYQMLTRRSPWSSKS